ncbi:MAG: hypothetical protein ACXABD_22015 [Candidatus Thorarchaeota archaeon]|jgi:hypothetical protein
MDEKKVLIYVEGGLVQDVYSEDIDLITLDYDSLEGGYCPYCNAELTWVIPLKDRLRLLRSRIKRKLGIPNTIAFSTKKEICPECRIDWKNTGADEIYDLWVEGKFP